MLWILGISMCTDSISLTAFASRPISNNGAAQIGIHPCRQVQQGVDHLLFYGLVNLVEVHAEGVGDSRGGVRPFCEHNCPQTSIPQANSYTCRDGSL